MWTAESHGASFFSDPFGPPPEGARTDAACEQTAATARQAVAAFRRLEANAMADVGASDWDPPTIQRDPAWPNRVQGVTSTVAGDLAWRR
jgi:hypothetical protein